MVINNGSVGFTEKKRNRASYKLQCGGTETCVKHINKKITNTIYSEVARINLPSVTPTDEPGPI